MARNIVELVDSVADDLKVAYKRNPSGVWKNPCLIMQDTSGATKILDGDLTNEQVAMWMKQNVDPRKLKVVVTGRMVVKYGKFIDPSTNNPIIEKKAIMVMGKNLKTGRTRVSIVPCHEHRDYRDEETIKKNGQLPNHNLKSPDVTKKILDGDKTAGYLTAQFGKEEILDSRNGHKFLSDPLLTVIDKQRLDKIKEEAEKKNPFEKGD